MDLPGHRHLGPGQSRLVVRSCLPGDLNASRPFPSSWRLCRRQETSLRSTKMVIPFFKKEISAAQSTVMASSPERQLAALHARGKSYFLLINERQCGNDGPAYRPAVPGSSPSLQPMRRLRLRARARATQMRYRA